MLFVSCTILSNVTGWTARSEKACSDRSLALRDSIARHCGCGRSATAIPRLTLLRSNTPTVPIGTVYQPVLCIIAQGRKRVMLGNRVFEYDAAKYLIVSVDLPISGESARRPLRNPTSR